MTSLPWLRRIATFALTALAASNLAFALLLLFSDGGAVELRPRWIEQQYVLRHKNPFDVHAQARTGQLEQVEPDLGVPTPGYPPWTYFTAIALLWPRDWMTVRLCFAAVNLGCLACIAGWISRQARREDALLWIAAVFAINSLAATLGLAQLGILVMGALVAAYWSDQGGQPVLAGLFLGIALLKPTLSGPFVLPYLVQGRWRSLAVAAAYTGAASTVVWLLVGADPITMLRQMQTAAVEWGNIDYTGALDPIALLTGLGVPPRRALQLAPLLALMLGLALMWSWRRGSMLPLFAVAAVVGRCWVFHHPYDDVILLFVLFGLMERLREGFTPALAVASVVLWLTLWLPQYSTTGMVAGVPLWLRPGFDALLLLSQVGCLAVLLGHTPLRHAPRA